MAPKQCGKFQFAVFDGGAKYALLSASLIACNVSLSILEIVALPILNVKAVSYTHLTLPTKLEV